MRWVILTDDFAPMASGVATWTAAAASSLAGAGDEVSVFARRRPGLGGDERYEVRPVGGPSFGRYGGLWTVLSGQKAIREADAVLASTWPVAVHAVSLRRRAHAPFHVVFHGSDLTRPPVHPRGLRRVLRRATHKWAVSQYLADQVKGCRVLPAPIDGGPSRAISGGRWGLVARATALKGGERFVRIVAAAGVGGVVVGDGPALRGWKDLTESLRADIVFTGQLDAKRALAEMSRMEVLLHLPRTHEDGSGAEGAGLVLFEAASLGVPGVGCRTGGVPEAVGPGLVLDDPDDPRKSAQAILAWLDDQRGQQARAWLTAHHGTRRLAVALRGM